MSAVDDVLRRLRTDRDFRSALERDPAGTLDGRELSDADICRIDQALRAPTASMERFFADRHAIPRPTNRPTPPASHEGASRPERPPS